MGGREVSAVAPARRGAGRPARACPRRAGTEVRREVTAADPMLPAGLMGPGSPVAGAESSRRQSRFPDIRGEVDRVGRRVAGRPSEAPRAFQSAPTVLCMTDGDNSSTR
jgi:hypothetical protein